MEISDDLLMAIHMADNGLSSAGRPFGWGEGNFEEDQTEAVDRAWDEACKAGARLWLDRHGDMDHPWVKCTREWLEKMELQQRSEG